MKKILGISLVAVLAATPLMAMAETGDSADTNVVEVSSPAHVASPVVASTAPGYALAVANGENDGKVATAGYVKGAYNASMQAINKLDATKQGVLNENQMAAVNSGITETKVGQYDAVKSAVENETTGLAAAHTAINTINTGAVMTSGITSEKVGQYDAVKSAVENQTTGLAAAHTAITNINQSDVMQSGINATKVGQYDNLVTASAHYATDTGVENTVKTAISNTTATVDLSGLAVTNAAVGGTATASVPVMDTWGTETPGTPIAANVNLANTMTAVALTGDSENQSVTITAPTTVTYSENNG